MNPVGFGKEKQIPILVGATGTGKTAVALALAGRLDGEVISADSRQVFRQLSIGTAKPQGKWVRRSGHGTKEYYDVDGVPHHLMDFLDPKDTFSAGLFAKEAGGLIDAFLSRRLTPIVAGGTGLYVKALADGMAPLPGRDEMVRKALTALAERDGREGLHRELARADPESAARIPANNLQRVMRALEVYLLTNRPLSWWQKEKTEPSPFRFCWFGLQWPQEVLEEHLALRCRAMARGGMLEETSRALKAGVPPDAPGLQAVGYAEAVRRVKGELGQEEFEKAFFLRTRQYVKRQLTWFRAEKRIRWLRVSGPPDPDQVADEIVVLLSS